MASSSAQEAAKSATIDTSTTADYTTTMTEKATVVGIYGLPGSGKTFLSQKLKDRLGTENFWFFEGSEEISRLLKRGMGEFHNMTETDKAIHRGKAMDHIRKECVNDDKVGVVTGHFMFWREESEKGTVVWTEKDASTYTHVLYLDTAVELIDDRLKENPREGRSPASTAHYHKWQQAEKSKLRELCRQNGTLFSVVPSNPQYVDSFVGLLEDFRLHSQDFNTSQAEAKLDTILAGQNHLKTCLALDGDGTLTAVDTGHRFWAKASKTRAVADGSNTLTNLFRGPLKHSYIAFRQAMLLYEESFSDTEFENLCQQVVKDVDVKIHPEFESLLKMVGKQKHVTAVIVTSGLRRVWELILEDHKLSGSVQVVGGSRLSDGFVVTAAVKEALVALLQTKYQLHVWAFGDTPLDLDMLKKANEAIVVVGNGPDRSGSMDDALKDAFGEKDFHPRQLLLPSNATPRLDFQKLPEIDIKDPKVQDNILQRQPHRLTVINASECNANAAKVIATAMRDSAISGPALREAHRRVGYYLAIHYLTDIIGIEDTDITHVQGEKVTGSRLDEEKRTTIMALMRGGEPMAYGVSEAFPTARFVHVHEPKNINAKEHLHGQKLVILVDSVINTGKTIADTVSWIRNDQQSKIRIVIVAGVVQAECVKEANDKNPLQVAGRLHNLELVTLRTSPTAFVGSGATDTGNRLFNTTHLIKE